VTWNSLFVTPDTLKTHLRMIYRKLGAESRKEAVTRAREGGLIWPSAPHRLRTTRLPSAQGRRCAG
jgi:Bacterial regulatory proteins, luxR family